MDGTRFDDLSRRLAQDFTRRTAVKGIGGGLLAAVGLWRGAGAQVTQASCGNKVCARNPAICTGDCVCCVYPNGNSRCRPPQDCRAPGEVRCADHGDCPSNFYCEEGSCYECFVAGTRIAMADGSSRPIELVAAGDLVLGQSGSLNRVVRVAQPLLGNRSLYAINGSVPFVTAEHPFGTVDGWKSVNPAATARITPDIPVRRLEVGDRLLALAAVRVPAMAGGGVPEAAEVRLEQVVLQSLIGMPAAPTTQLYNLVLDGDHTYFANDLLVHNKS